MCGDDMMTIFTRIILACALALPAAVHAELEVGKEPAPEKAGVKLVPPASNTGAVAQSAQAPTAREVKKTGGLILRCWQHGRLLYEEAGFAPDAQRQPNAASIRRTDGESVVVFDQKDAFCMLSKK
jgi:hypothetical protein